METRIGVLGLGAMGSALARAQLKAGHDTKVWNRTPGKANSLVAEGAKAVESGAQVAITSDVILVCVDTCANAEASLGAALDAGALDGRVVVQLGTTSPAEARRFADRVRIAGAAALDGAIMCYPDSVGPQNQAPLMVGGDLKGMDVARPALKQVSANLIELGDNIAAPAALDLGYLTMCIALFAGAAHAARLCEVEGANLEMLALLSANGPKASDRLEIIEKDAFSLGSLHDGGSLAVWADVAKSVHQHAVDAKIPDDFSQSLWSFYSKAVDAGFGTEDVAALVKALR
jgi:3-hydroxyisobutyrate dehydrogenase-like beta-hydroxyacid dehydrogenase